ncbi:MAG: hypothetical protein R3C51_03895 [Parvularculaceae bacterium]
MAGRAVGADISPAGRPDKVYEKQHQIDIASAVRQGCCPEIGGFLAEDFRHAQLPSAAMLL